MDREQNYINMYGSIRHCYKIHIRRMKERWEPYVSYSWFWDRVRRKRRSLYGAIHTPAKKKEKKWFLYNIIYIAKNLFGIKHNGRERKRASRH